MLSGLLLAENGSQTTNLGTERGTNLLRRIRDEFLNCGHNFLEQNISFNECTESRNLTSNGSSYLGLGVFEELDEGRNKIAADDLVVDGLCNL